MLQYVLGAPVIFFLVMLFHGITTTKPATTQQNTRQVETQTQERQVPIQSQGGVNVLRIDRVLQSSGAWEVVLGASNYYNVPADVLLTHWYLESGMQLGGDHGGAGGYFALAQVVRKQSEPSERHRWHRFVANEADMRAICEHCGYDCANIQGSSTGALGPMQFQPSTWILGAVDANGDGRACPLNLADAMYTAARKLSRDHARLGTWALAMMAYAGTGPRARAYVNRAERLRLIMQRYVEAHGN